MIILIVDVSLVITKNVFTKLFELCECRNLIFCVSKTAATVTIAVAVHYFAFILRYIYIYAVKITLSEFIFWSIENPIRHLFHTLKKFTSISGLDTKPNLCYGKCNHFTASATFAVPARIYPLKGSLLIIKNSTKSYFYTIYQLNMKAKYKSSAFINQMMVSWKRSFNVHSSNQHYLSIPQHTGSLGTVLRKQTVRPLVVPGYSICIQLP